MPTAKLAPSCWMTPTSYAISGAARCTRDQRLPFAVFFFFDFLGFCPSRPSASSTSAIAALSLFSRFTSTAFSFLFCSGTQTAYIDHLRNCSEAHCSIPHGYWG